MGDPSGVGPEVIMKAMASPELAGLAVFIVIGDIRVMELASKGVYGGKLASRSLTRGHEEIAPEEDAVNVWDPVPELKSPKPASGTDEGSRKALECLAAAVRFMKNPSDKSPKALVTAPLSKEAIARIHPGFIGHTEYLQQAYSAKLVTMVLVGESLCVVPVTRHIPIKDVASSLTTELIFKTLAQVIEGRKLICGKNDVRIGVCALNPHCGEGGKIGHEEIDVIAPAVEKTKEFYKNLSGPISADVIFYKALKKEFDVVVSMYHDQCLSPFKMVDFDRGVNMTLGLEHVRTSPDHGTAFDIAGKGLANPGSMIQAVKLAIRAATEKQDI